MPPNSRATTPTSEPSPLKSAFVISPIGESGSEVHRKAEYALKYIFRKALSRDEWDVHRADEGKNSDSISQHVIKNLHQADLVIADLSGHNPNVFYELAIAHGWRKPVVHLITKGEDLPFDVVDQRAIFYDITDLASVEDAIERLRECANHAVKCTTEFATPLTTFERFNQVRADPSGLGGAVAEALEHVIARLARIEGQLNESTRNENSYRREAGEGGANRFSSYYAAASKNLAALSGVDANPSPATEAMLRKLGVAMESLGSESR